MRKIDIKSGNVENYIVTSNAHSNLKETAKNENGITLVALVITIIVMLILVGITLTVALKGDLFNLAKRTSVETRASMVDEKVIEWKVNKKADEYSEGNATAQSLDELLNDLETQQLITKEEIKEIEQNMEIKIGDKEILFYEFPDGYTRCEYIESSGEQIIFSNELPSNDLTVDVTFALSEKVTTSSTNIFITAYYADGNRYRPIKLENGYFRCQKMGGYDTLFQVAQDLNKHNFKYNTSDGKVYWDGVEKGTVYNSINPPNDLPLGIFGQVQKQSNNVNYAKNSTCKMKLYDYRTYYKSSGLLKSRYIPCTDSNKKPCLYEVFSEKTFYNQGSGEFGVGYIN